MKPVIKLFIKTLHRRREVLDVTLKSLAESDWGDDPIVIPDNIPIADKHVSEVNHSLHMFYSAMGMEWDYMLFCEDDVEFGAHFRHNIENWKLFRDGQVTIASLYGDPWEGRPVEDNTCWHPAMGIAGSQAILIRRDYVPHIVAGWNNRHRVGTDLLIYRTLPDVVPRHAPSLVQHMQVESAAGNPSHSAASYQRDWKAS